MRTHRVRVVLALLVAAALLPGCGDPGGRPAATTSSPPLPTTAAPSGIRGLTVVDGGCPMARDATPCPDHPIAATIAVTPDPPAAATSHTANNEQGHFEIAVPPGTYHLQAGSPTAAPVPFAAPIVVVVHAGAYTTVTVHLDSGVR